MIFSCIFSYAQVGINQKAPKATFDIAGTPSDPSKLDGILIPRLTGNELRAKTYTSLQDGAFVFVTVPDSAPGGQTIDVKTKGLYYYNATLNKWVYMQTASDAGTIKGSGNAKIDYSAEIGQLTLTSEDGLVGYATTVTTPDGRFSVRIIAKSGTTYANSNLQLRNNTSSPLDVSWNGHWLWGGSGGNESNGTIFPAGIWAGAPGNNQATATNVSATANPSWGNAGIYAGDRPEQRIYSWTTTSGTDKVFYTLKAMMGTAIQSGALNTANATNCPGGVCTNSKVYLSIEQYSVK